MQAREVGSWERMHQSRGIHGRGGWRLQVRRVRRPVDRAGRGAWVSWGVGKGAFKALSMERRSDESHGDWRYRLMIQGWTRRGWRMKGSRVR